MRLSAERTWSMSPRKASILATPVTLPRVPNIPAALSFTRPGNGGGAPIANHKFPHRTHLTFSLWTVATYPISGTYRPQERPRQAWPSGPFTDVSPIKSVILGAKNALCRANAPDASPLHTASANALSGSPGARPLQWNPSQSLASM
jgi:hypothetical protein